MEVTIQDITKRLKQLGYTATDDDHPAIQHEIELVTNYTLNHCNLIELPDIIKPKMVDRICSYFLYFKKNSGSLEGFNYDAVVKSIKEGDSTLTFAVGGSEDTPENRFDAFVKKLEQTYDKWINPHRRLRW